MTDFVDKEISIVSPEFRYGTIHRKPAGAPLRENVSGGVCVVLAHARCGIRRPTCVGINSGSQDYVPEDP